jgi:hypothetical protein
MNKILIAYLFGILTIFTITIIHSYLFKKKTKPIEKLYFEFRKKDSSVTADGFLRYKGKWCPIVLNDSMAVIYQ